ncbi:MAG: hypothetical protein E7411_08420 [Ruminococcaceae bacterium]|nr:hypothetical protein [Oscillospiraceae bacterium]
MKAIDIMKELFSIAEEREYSPYCDVCKAGDPEKEVRKVAVTMFPTVKVIKEAVEWGADLLIVHEPLYFNGREEVNENDKVATAKKELVEKSGLTIFRYHDHPHYTVPDIIAKGEFKYMQLPGRYESTEIFDLARFYPDEPITASELARHIEINLGVKHLRICGARDIPSTVISSVFGSGGEIAFNELKREDSQIVLVGETCEWAYGEYARDAAELGFNKSLIIMGHIGSERDGMKYTRDLLLEKHPELSVEYFECDEVYTYTDKF